MGRVGRRRFCGIKPDFRAITLHTALPRTTRMLYQAGKVWIFSDTAVSSRMMHACFDINTHEFTVLDYPPGDESTYGGQAYQKDQAVAAPNGYFYLPPSAKQDMMKISISNPSVYSFFPTSYANSSYPKFGTGVLLPNGKIFWGMSGAAHTGGLWIDTSDDSLTQDGVFGSNSYFRDSILGSDGMIYSSAYMYLSLLEKKDYNTRLSTAALSSTGNNLFIGTDGNFIILKDKIYNYLTGLDYPNTVNNGIYDVYINVPGGVVYSIDPMTSVLTIFSIQNNGVINIIDTMQLPATWNFYSSTIRACYAPNGLIYIMPSANGSTNILYVIDTHTYVDSSDAVIPSSLSTLATSNYNLYFNK